MTLHRTTSLFAALTVAVLTTACRPAVVPWVPAGQAATVHVADPGGGGGPTVTVVDASAKAHEVCPLPCDEQMPSGTATFTLSRGGRPAVSGRAVVPPGASEITFHRRRTAQAWAGAVTAVAGLLLGFPLAIDTAGGPSQSGGVSSTDITLGIVGVGALVVGSVVLFTAGSDGVDVH